MGDATTSSRSVAHVEIAARYGMRPRALLPAESVAQALRGNYAVDMLAS